MTLIAKFRTCLLVVIMALALPLQAEAANFMARDHLIVDLRFGVAQMQRWQGLERHDVRRRGSASQS